MDIKKYFYLYYFELTKEIENNIRYLLYYFNNVYLKKAELYGIDFYLYY